MNGNNNCYKPLVLMWLGHMLVDVMIGIWPVFKTMAHLDLAVAGMIAAICPFIGEGLQVYFGALGDKGYRKALVMGGILAAGSSALFPYVSSTPALFLLLLITCLGSGAFHPSAVAVTSSLTAKRKGLFVTIFASGGAFGFAISQITFTQVFTHLNQNTIWMVLPLVALVCVIAFSTLQTQFAPPGRKYGFNAMKKMFQNRDLRTLYLSQVCNQSIMWGTVFLLPDVLTAKGYESWICFGGGHLFLVMGSAMMMVPGGYLADRYSEKNVIIWASLSSLTLFYFFLLGPTFSNGAVLSLLFALGASSGVVNPVAVSYGSKLMPNRPGLVGAFLMGLVWCIAEAIGPGGGGLLTKCFTENAPVKALSILGLCYAGTFFTILFLPKEVGEEYEWETA